MTGCLSTFSVAFRNTSRNINVPLDSPQMNGVDIQIVNTSSQTPLSLSHTILADLSSTFTYSTDSTDRIVLSVTRDGESLFENEIEVVTDIHFDIKSPSEGTVGAEIVCKVSALFRDKVLDVRAGGVEYFVRDPKQCDIDVTSEVTPKGSIFRYTPKIVGVYEIEIFYLQNPLTSHTLTVTHGLTDLSGSIQIQKSQCGVGEMVKITGSVVNSKSGVPLSPSEYKFEGKHESGVTFAYDPVKVRDIFVPDLMGVYEFTLKCGEKVVAKESLAVQDLPDSAKYRGIGMICSAGSVSNISLASQNPQFDLSRIFEMKVVEIAGGNALSVTRRGQTFQFTAKVNL